MRALLAACRELAVDHKTSPKMFDKCNHFLANIEICYNFGIGKPKYMEKDRFPVCTFYLQFSERTKFLQYHGERLHKFINHFNVSTSSLFNDFANQNIYSGNIRIYLHLWLLRHDDNITWNVGITGPLRRESTAVNDSPHKGPVAIIAMSRLTWNILCMRPANERRRNVVSH